MIHERQVSIEIQCNYVLINAQKGIPKSLCKLIYPGFEITQRPRQHHRDVLTDEADSHRRKLL